MEQPPPHPVPFARDRFPRPRVLLNTCGLNGRETSVIYGSFGDGCRATYSCHSRSLSPLVFPCVPRMLRVHLSLYPLGAIRFSGFPADRGVLKLEIYAHRNFDLSARE